MRDAKLQATTGSEHQGTLVNLRQLCFSKLLARQILNEFHPELAEDVPGTANCHATHSEHRVGLALAKGALLVVPYPYAGRLPVQEGQS